MPTTFMSSHRSRSLSTSQKSQDTLHSLPSRSHQVTLLDRDQNVENQTS